MEQNFGSWKSIFLGILENLGNLGRVEPSFGTWVWKPGLREGFWSLTAEFHHERGKNGAPKPGTPRVLFIGCIFECHVVARVGHVVGSKFYPLPLIGRPQSLAGSRPSCATSWGLTASDFGPRTCKIHNFRVRAPFSTFFICTRSWKYDLQLSFRLRQLVLILFLMI